MKLCVLMKPLIKELTSTITLNNNTIKAMTHTLATILNIAYTEKNYRLLQTALHEAKDQGYTKIKLTSLKSQLLKEAERILNSKPLTAVSYLAPQ